MERKRLREQGEEVGGTDERSRDEPRTRGKKKEEGNRRRTNPLR